LQWVERAKMSILHSAHRMMTSALFVAVCSVMPEVVLHTCAIDQRLRRLRSRSLARLRQGHVSNEAIQRLVAICRRLCCRSSKGHSILKVEKGRKSAAAKMRRHAPSRWEASNQAYRCQRSFNYRLSCPQQDRMNILSVMRAMLCCSGHERRYRLIDRNDIR